MSDVLTMYERTPELCALKVGWIGDGNNMANSWIEAASVFGFPLTLACPAGFSPNETILARARVRSPLPIVVLRDPAEAIRGAEVINVDVWASMGQEAEQEQRLGLFQNYQLNAALLAKAGKEAIVLHCLPAHRGEEITEEVLEGPQSVVFDQAENKMHIHAAILEHWIAGAH
jgi:ornithine carbamoyltransferase